MELEKKNMNDFGFRIKWDDPKNKWELTKMDQKNIIIIDLNNLEHIHDAYNHPTNNNLLKNSIIPQKSTRNIKEEIEENLLDKTFLVKKETKIWNNWVKNSN